ncbi:hypothetical protein [Marinigracilibium pacificum]|uniref:Uncharacterized protein n=1 Tax=Marinigracilibium pacificum TaxID=2729599 RepID=A0A848J4W4_9BACT|nr:hypothetical protein [Marinigracilibium pacificum]NMM50756.1 hypothetical protein [Marinigracilibium pacificum]
MKILYKPALKVFGFCCFLFSSCIIEPHNIDEPQYFVRNNTSETLLWDSYNLGINRSMPLEILIDQDVYAGMGGITTVDSVIFVKKLSGDSLIYRYPTYETSSSWNNHFFERVNWIESESNVFYFTLTDEDFK